jgi:hypothetical protein
MNCKKKPVVLVMLFFGFYLSISPASAGTISQNFTNNNFNTKYFWLNTNTDLTKPSVVVTNNRLEIAVPTSPGELAAAGLQLFDDYKLTGDYDIQVNFNLLTWTDNNGVDAGIQTTSYRVARVNINYGQGNTNAYLVSFIGQQPTGFHTVLTSDNQGKLRLTRIGNTVSGYYWQTNGWQLIASNTDPTYGAPIDFYVGGAVNGGAAIQTWVAFDNLKVTNAVFPTSLSPMNLLLLD